jgi:hypothetical protein
LIADRDAAGGIEADAVRIARTLEYEHAVEPVRSRVDR